MAVKRLESRIFELSDTDKMALALMPYRSKNHIAADKNSCQTKELHVFDLLNGTPFSLNTAVLGGRSLNE